MLNIVPMHTPSTTSITGSMNGRGGFFLDSCNGIDLVGLTHVGALQAHAGSLLWYKQVEGTCRINAVLEESDTDILSKRK